MPASSSSTDNGLSPGRVARPRSVAIVGPYGSGKSTLYESLMAAAGAPVRRTGELRARAMTTEMTLGHCSYLGDPWSLLDCPGSIEFAAETAAALSVVDLAVIVCEPTVERAMTLAPLLKILEDRAIPHLLFVNKIDTLQTRVRDMLEALQAYSRRPLLLRQVPIREGDSITGYVDVVSERAYRYRKGQPSELIKLPSGLQQREDEALGSLVEVLADHDDGILEKVLEDVKPSTEEVYRQLRKDQGSDAIVEVLLGSADRGGGVQRLWKALRHDGPDPLATSAERGVEAEGEALVQIFKTVYAAHTGKLSYGRVWRGSVKDGGSLGGTRIGGLYRLPGGEATKVPEAGPGELVALGRMDGVATGALLTPGGTGDALPFPPVPPPPVFSLAIATQDRKDDVKLSGALQKLSEEDLSLSVEHNPETGETLLHGQGEIHLNAVIDRLAKIYNLKITDVAAAGAVQGNDPARDPSAFPPQTPDRRPWPIRRCEDRDQPARPRRGLPVRRPHRRRRRAPAIYPGGGRGGRGGDAQGAVRLSGGRCVGHPGRRHLPCGRQLGHGVQERDPHRHGRGAGEMRAGPARADRPCHGQRAERLHRQRPTPAERTARPDIGLCRTAGLARLGRCRSAGARGRAA